MAYFRITLKEPIACGNPKILETLNHPNRSISKSWLKAIPRDGGLFCAWCNLKELPKARKKYCSDDCADSSGAYCYPQNSEHAFRFMLLRQNLCCSTCSFSYEDALSNKRKKLNVRTRRDIQYSIKCLKETIPAARIRGYSPKEELDEWEESARKELSKTLKDYFECKFDNSVWTYGTADSIRNYHRNLKDGREPEVDHIIPVKMDGMAIGFDNVQILCYTCHKQKTAKDNGDIRRYKIENSRTNV